MNIQKIPFPEVPQLSKKDVAYATQEKTLRPFFKYEVSLDAFAAVIEDKKKEDIDRALLADVLEDQYSSIPNNQAAKANIQLLRAANTFTVTTAHQPSLFTGPLYYIYKICSVIKLSERLSKAYPDYNFVPIFITGGEDHDFEEVNHLRLFNKTIEWNSGEKGSVGMMKTESLTNTLEELKEILGASDLAQETYQKIHTAYTSYERYSHATIAFVHSLFEHTGLVIAGMNDKRLKARFIPILEKELFEQPSQALVEATAEQLTAAGYSGQAFPRPINLFYLDDQMRERIVQENGQFQVLNTDISFDKTELKTFLQEHPERFSPNVVIRPLYQEYILPNLAYVGGGGEIAYWLERKSQFEHFGINFPMLIRRNSVLWVDKGSVKKMDKLGLGVKDLFQDVEDLIKQYVESHATEELHLTEEKGQIQQLFTRLAEKIKAVDPTLEKTVLAEGAKQTKSMEQLESKLVRAEKQKHETALKQIRSLKDRLFPSNSLQERKDNFLNLYLKYGNTFFEVLHANLDPLEEGFIVIEDR